MQTKLIIYDFDGVIVDSRQAVYRYYDAIFEHFGLPLIDWHNSELGRMAYGMTHVQLMSRYASGQKLEDMLNFVPSFTQAQLIDMSPLEKGVLETVPEFAQTRHLAICTNRGASVNDYLAHYDIESYFPYIVTAKDVTQAKPSPEGVEKIMAHYGAAPEETLFIGDSDADYHAATNAGAKFIAYRNELFGSPLINDHREVVKYL